MSFMSMGTTGDRRESLMSFGDRRESLMSFGDRRESFMSFIEGAIVEIEEEANKSVAEDNTESVATSELLPSIASVAINPRPLAPAPPAPKALEERSSPKTSPAPITHKTASGLPKISPVSGMDRQSTVTHSNVTHSTYSSDGSGDEEEGIEYIEKIGPYDIICGRNNGAHNWVGNRRFRITIMMNLQRYTEAPTREEKTQVIKSVISLLTNTEEVGARFIKKVGEGAYLRLKDKQIREKVGHAFRDMMSMAEKEGGKLEAK